MDTSNRPCTIIEPGRRGNLPDFKELARYKGLLRALVWRNVRVRYKNTGLGMLWVVLQPLLQMGVYTLVFGLWARIPVGDVPYSVHVLSGLVLLFFINRVLSEAANVVRNNQALTRKVYFPKLLLPMMLVLSACVDLIVAMALFVMIVLLQGVAFEPTVLLAPLLLIWLIAFSCGLAVWFAALGIRFRDVAMLTPVMTMLLMFMSPVIYPVTMVPEYLLPIYSLNPMVGIVTTFRWLVLGIGPFIPVATLFSVIEVSILLLTGLMFFARTEQNFNDYL